MSQYADDANPADIEEQAMPVQGGEPEGTESETQRRAGRDDVDEGDLLEQATPVSGDDEDYPNDLEVEPDV